MRQAASALYNAAAAAIMAHEGAMSAARGGDARRMLMARMVVDHRLKAQDPLAATMSAPGVEDALLSKDPVSAERARALLAA